MNYITSYMSASLWAGFNLRSGEIIVKAKVSTLVAQMLIKDWYLGFSCFDDPSASAVAAEFVTTSKLGDCFELDGRLFLEVCNDGIYLCEISRDDRIAANESLRSLMEVHV